jgi:hypothetical protein
VPILIRLREPKAMSRDLAALMQQSPDEYELECWSEGMFCCPYCLRVLDEMPGHIPGPFRCPACQQRFWARWLPWAAAITSTDDPQLRKGKSS